MNRNKRNGLLATLFFLLGLTAMAQQNDNPVQLLPYQANGYLVMDAFANPQVVSWHIEVKTKAANSTGQFDYTTVYSELVSGKSYTLVPESYGGNDLYLFVTGLDQGGSILVEHGPQPVGPGPHGFTPCMKYCVGKTYAYGIKLNVHGNEVNSTMQMVSIRKENGEYFYQYMSPTEFAAKAVSPPLNYYNVPAWSHVAPGIDGRIVKLDGVDASDGLKDVNGFDLTGTVYAVGKYLGDWRGSVIESNTLAQGEELCNQNTAFFINKLNSGGDLDGRPSITCNGQTGDGSIPTDGPGSGSATGNAQTIDCWDEIDDWADDSTNSLNGNAYPFTYLADLTDCLDGIQADTPPPPNVDVRLWPADLVQFSIKPVSLVTSQAYGNPQVIHENDFYDVNGSFVSPSIVVEEGLYMMGLQFRGGEYRTIYFNADQPTTYTYELANLLEATIYPVPITGNSFSLQLSSRANISCQYVLMDMQGNTLHSQQINVATGPAQQVQVSPAGGLPNGTLVNKFIFSDGSTITKMTLK